MLPVSVPRYIHTWLKSRDRIIYGSLNDQVTYSAEQFLKNPTLASVALDYNIGDVQMMSLDLTLDLRVRLRNYAKPRGLSLGDIIRLALLAEHSKEKEGEVKTL